MFPVDVAVTLVAIVANAFSGITALVHFRPIVPAMAKAGVPESWLTTLGVLKTAGAAGLLLGLVGVPLIGEAAAVGLIIFFSGAVYFHIRARDVSPQLGLAMGFLMLAVATLSLDLAS